MSEDFIIEKKGDKKIKYIKLQQLGEGGFGKCYKIKNEENNEIYAGKFLSKENLNNLTSQEFLKKRQKLYNEIKIHKSINHPNIVKYYHSFEDSDNLCILLEYCETDLGRILKKRKRLTELEVQYYLKHLIEALKYLHEQKIIHRDLKPSNILITKNMVLKLSDFGLAKETEDAKKESEYCGTEPYLAPEIFKFNYSYEIDIWSLGIIMYQLIYGVLPFKKNKEENLYNKLINKDYKFPEDIPVSNAAKDLIKQILVPNPIDRPKLDLILTHDFFKLGKSIPKFLSPDMASEKPSIDYIRQYMPEADDNGVVDKIVATTNLMNLEDDEEKNMNNKIIKYEDKEIWIKNFILKEKYGFAYRLNNDIYGIIFNDMTNFFISPDEKQFFEIKNNEIIFHENVLVNKELLYKKSILREIKKELEEEEKEGKEEEEVEVEQNEDSEDDTISTIFLKYYLITKYCLYFFFSNKNWQIIFGDKSQILFNDKNKVISYINDIKERIDCDINDIEQNKIKDNYFVKKYNYAKIIFNHEKEKAKKNINE